MPSTGAIAIREYEVKKNLKTALESIGCEIPELGNSYRNSDLERVLYLEQVLGALKTFDEVVEALLPEPELAFGFNGDEKDVEEELESVALDEEEPSGLALELDDMNSTELRHYADVVGISYPSNIKDETLRNKILTSVE